MIHHEEFLRLFAWARERKCTRCCDEVVDEDFKDNLSVAVFETDGICQPCQTELWPEPNEDDLVEMEKLNAVHQANGN